MSKFTRGDIVLTGSPMRRGQVILTWSERISERTGIPLVQVLMDPDNEIAYFDEDELELAEYLYEFVAVSVDQEDFEQTHIGDWGTLEAAKDDAIYVVAEEDNEEYKETHMIQINRRRKAGPTIGIQAFRW